MSTTVRSVLAWLLLAVPVAAEAVHLLDDDTPGADQIFAITHLVGWILVWTVVRELHRLTAGSSRWGPRLVTAGVALQAGFAGVYLASSLIGEPAEASFILFLLGFLGLTTGGLLWAVRLWRTSYLASCGLAGVAILGLLTIAAGDNVVHELALQGSYLAWILVGVGAASVRPNGSGRVARVSASSR
jgi:hypothetical protein